jgi:hypothetical protein
MGCSTIDAAVSIEPPLQNASELLAEPTLSMSLAISEALTELSVIKDFRS